MPEKSVQEVARPLREQYEKGLAAFQRQNYDYALDILTKVLEADPTFYECRQALRASQFKKTSANTGFFRKVLGGASSSPLIAKAQLASRKNPAEAINIAEQILNNDPNSTSAHKIIADAARVLDMPKTAILSLEILVRASPKDAEFSMKLGEAYLKAGLVKKAEEVYTRLWEANPNDPDLGMILKNISARTVLDEGGYGALQSGNGSYRDILKDKEQSVSMEQEGRQVKDEDVASRLILEYEKRLEEEPDNNRLVRSIAELYVQKNDYDKALEYYRGLFSREGLSDPSLEKIVLETALQKFDYLSQQVDKSSSNYEEEIARIKKERTEFLLGESKKRADKYPNDLQLRYDLGLLYFQANKISEAIQEFQKSQSNPHRRISSLNYLGQCFAKRGMNDLAARTFQNGLKEKLIFDEEKKELLYNYGIVLDKMGKKEEGIEQLKQIYEIDIGFRDVAERVDAYYSSQSS
ncbi:MAG: Tetratricopeptide repeat protein [Verrucomicrobiales bacterium]|nr:Tetratricopeptide repeat protein [Verrucomicrobiales bacterium]MDB6129574.1 Tetratricopeptide repeat protein [Verrucomicrobiales bacterium]